MNLIFDNEFHQLTSVSRDGVTRHIYTAYNNVDSHSNGPWPKGKFDFLALLGPEPNADANSAFGAVPRLAFNVPGRVGMEIHAGRAEEADGLGRKGPEHATEGCIRSDAEALTEIIAAHRQDHIQTLEVV